MRPKRLSQCSGSLAWPGAETATALSHKVVALDVIYIPCLGAESYSSKPQSTHYRAPSMGPLQPRLIYQEHESENNSLISSWPLLYTHSSSCPKCMGSDHTKALSALEPQQEPLRSQPAESLRQSGPAKKCFRRESTPQSGGQGSGSAKSVFLLQ